MPDEVARVESPAAAGAAFGMASPSPVTARAVGLGLLIATLINLAMPYNDHYLYNTLLIGNHFPVIALVILMVLVMVVNLLARRFLGVTGLSTGELLLVWAMIGVSGGICSAGAMRYIPTWIAVPTYYSTGPGEYGDYVFKFLPDWLVLSRDPNSPAVKWFMEGLPRGQHIPWELWLVPVGAWILFMLLLFSANFAFVSLFFQQWALRERLIFPLVQLPVLMAEKPREGSLLNSFLGNPLTWAGFALPVILWGFNGLRSYFPAVPAIPTSFSFWNLFPDRPWSEFHLHDAKLFFIVIGFTFMLPSELSLSMFFFYILYRLSFVYIAWLGAGATGFWGQWSMRVDVFQYAGAVLAIAGFLFWTARQFIRDWWGRVAAGTADPVMDPIRPRPAFLLMAAGFLGMIAWQMASGAQWWVAVFSIVFLLCVILVLTRVTAEMGTISVHSSLVTYDLVTKLFPAGWFTGFSLNAVLMQRAMLGDLREILMPYVTNGLKAAAQARMHMGKVMAVFALTAAVSLATSAYSRIATGYKYGALNTDLWASIWSVNSYMGGVTSIQKNPPVFELAGPGDAKALPVNLAHGLTGAGMALALFAMRARLPWWPLHPLGLVTTTTWMMMSFWFSIFLGWLAKTLVMTFGGAQVYRRVLPFFLGLVLGESVMAALWIILGLFTGTPGISVLPP